LKIRSFHKGFFSKHGINLSIKIFIVCISISLFLTIIIGVFTQSYIMKKFDFEIEKFEEGQVSKIANSIDMQLGEIEKIGQSYALNPNITQFMYLSERDILSKYSEVEKVQDMLSNTINSSNYISNIFIYYEKSGVILDFSAPLNYSIFYDSSWKEYFDYMAGNSCILDTHKIGNNSYDIRSSKYKNDIITFITNIPYVDKKKLGAVIINVDHSIVSDVLKNITENSDSLAFLTNGDGVIISSNDNKFLYNNINSITGTSFKSDKSADPESGIFKFTFSDRKMICYYTDMAINDWNLFFITPENIIFKKSIEIRFISILIMTCLLLLMIVLSLFVTRKLYKPINTITTTLKSVLSSNGSSSRNTNDILIIRNGLDMLFENKKSLENVISENKVLFREYFLSNLITGKIRTKELIISKAEYFQVNLDYKYFCVVAMKNNEIHQDNTDAEKSEVKKLAIMNIAQRAFEDEGIDIISSQDSNDNILLLVKLSDKFSADQSGTMICKCLNTIKNDAVYYSKTHVIMGIGKICNNVLDTGLSYKESLRALQYCFIVGDIANANKISYLVEDKLFYPLDMEKKVISLASICDYEKVMLCINSGIEEIICKNKNIDHIFICLSNLINLVTRCVSEFNLNLQNIVGKEDSRKISINDFNNIGQFKEWISNVFKKIIENNFCMHKEEDLSISSKFREYVEDNYMKDISLSMAAEHFGYNSSYFSRLFKENIGTNFFDYVSKVRIEKSKIMLSTTSNGIQKIAGLVGYNNRSSFIRSFSKHTSITPSEYRQKLGKL